VIAVEENANLGLHRGLGLGQGLLLEQTPDGRDIRPRGFVQDPVEANLLGDRVSGGLRRPRQLRLRDGCGHESDVQKSHSLDLDPRKKTP